MIGPSLLLSYCILLLPLTAVARPANPSSPSKGIDTRNSHDAVEGFRGFGRIVGKTNSPVKGRAENLVPTELASRQSANPPLGETTSNINDQNSTTNNAPTNANNPGLAKAVEKIPFDFPYGPIEVKGSIDIDSLDLVVELYILKRQQGVFNCNLHKDCLISVNALIAKGEVKIYIKNQYELWLFADLEFAWGKHYTVDKRILILPHDGALADTGAINGPVASGGGNVAAPMNGTTSATSLPGSNKQVTSPGAGAILNPYLTARPN